MDFNSGSLQKGPISLFLQRLLPLPYPAQSLQQEGLETIVPCNQIFLQLLIIQRGQQWHILHLPTMQMGKTLIKTLLIQHSWCYWGEKSQNRKAASGKELPLFYTFVAFIIITMWEQTFSVHALSFLVAQDNTATSFFALCGSQACGP